MQPRARGANAEMLGGYWDAGFRRAIDKSMVVASQHATDRVYVKQHALRWVYPVF